MLYNERRGKWRLVLADGRAGEIIFSYFGLGQLPMVIDFLGNGELK